MCCQEQQHKCTSNTDDLMRIICHIQDTFGKNPAAIFLLLFGGELAHLSCISCFWIGASGLVLLDWCFWIGASGLVLLDWCFWVGASGLVLLDLCFWVGASGLVLLCWCFWVGASGWQQLFHQTPPHQCLSLCSNLLIQPSHMTEPRTVTKT